MQRAVANSQKQSKQLKEEAEQALQVTSLPFTEVAEKWLEVRKPAPVQIDEAMQTGTPPTNQIRMQTWKLYEDNLHNHILPKLGHFPRHVRQGDRGGVQNR